MSSVLRQGHFSSGRLLGGGVVGVDAPELLGPEGEGVDTPGRGRRTRSDEGTLGLGWCGRRGGIWEGISHPEGGFDGALGEGASSMFHPEGASLGASRARASLHHVSSWAHHLS